MADPSPPTPSPFGSLCAAVFRTYSYSPDAYNRKLLQDAGVLEKNIAEYLPDLAEQGVDQSAWEAASSAEQLAAFGVLVQEIA
jgi:hypothetical protein